MHKGVLVILLCLIAVVAVLAWAVGSSLDEMRSGGTPPISSGSGEVTALLRSIEHRLARIEESLQKVEAAPQASGGVDRKPLSEDSQAIALDPKFAKDLTNAIEDLRAAALSMSFQRANLSALREKKPEIDWTEWQRFYDESGGDHAKMKLSLYFLSRSEILLRFGPPTSIDSDGSWIYEREGLSKGQVYHAKVEFRDDYVTHLVVWVVG